MLKSSEGAGVSRLREHNRIRIERAEIRVDIGVKQKTRANVKEEIIVYNIISTSAQQVLYRELFCLVTDG